MAVKSKYEVALAAFVAAKSQLYKPGTSWGEYSTAVYAADAAWSALAVAAANAANAVEA